MLNYRKLTENDLETFISMRITQLREEGAKEQIDLAPQLRDYYARHLADDTFVAWLALEDGRIVGRGTHEELLRTCELYKEIAMSQLSEEELGKGVA